jgi:hypothetical protein
MNTPAVDDNLMKVELLDAGGLIESQVNQNDYTTEVARIEKLDPTSLKTELTKLNNDIPLLAKEGRTEKIGLILKLLKHFNMQPNVRVYLHYFAQSEAQEFKDSKDTSLMQKIMGKIAKAFKLADSVDKESEKLKTT